MDWRAMASQDYEARRPRKSLFMELVMNSIQQIILGAGCVVAAFLFGSYINSNPSLGTPQGRVDESDRLTSEAIKLKMPEQMPMMTHRKEPEYDLENAESPTDLVGLPAPSDLSQSEPLRVNKIEIPALSIDQQDRHQAIAEQSPVERDLGPAPDFSHLADRVPGQSFPAEKDATKSTMPVLKKSTESSLKNLAQSFQRGNDFDQAAEPIETEAAEPPNFAATAGRTDLGKVRSTPGDTPSPQATIANVVADPVVGPAAESEQFVRQGSTPATGKNAIPEQPNVASPVDSGQVRSLARWDTEPRAAANEIAEPLPDESRSDDGLVGNSVLTRIEPDNGTLTNRATVSRLPFQLTDTGKAKLVRWRKAAANKISLQSTQFLPHTVEQGESLQSISVRYFGKPDFYLDIYLANRDQLSSPVGVPVGTVLKVPVYEDR